MKRNRYQRALCVLLSLVLAFSLAFAAAGTPAEDAHLHFHEDGKFRILNFSDFQDTKSLDSRVRTFIRQAVWASRPDLIVLTGDNIYGTKLSSASDTRTAIASFMDIFEELGVPVAIVFGNHDDEGKAYSKEEQMAIYSSYGVSISYDEGSSMAGCGTYNVPIYGSTQTDTVKFNLWMFDTGSNEPSGSYDYMRQNQLDWYVSKSNALKAANGGAPVPSIAFQHIIVKEIFDALQQVSSSTTGAISYDGKYYVLPSTAKPGSVLNEHPCPSKYGDEFSVCRAQGDVLAIVCGHDHINQFVVPHQGIDLICTPGTGYLSYGDDATRGARIIDLDEQTGTYSTRMLNLIEVGQPEYYLQSGTQKYVKDIALCCVQSAQYGSTDNALTAAYGRLCEAVDSANCNGVAIRMDLNGGSTSDSSSGNHYVICMGYTLTEDPAEAMRALGLHYGASSAAQYNGTSVSGCVWNTCGWGDHLVDGTDGAVDLNAGTSGNAIYFYASYDTAAGEPITEISVVNTGSNSISMSNYSGYTLACGTVGSNTGTSYADLNKSAKGDYVYALYKKTATGVTRISLDSTDLRSAYYEAAAVVQSESFASYSAGSRAALVESMMCTRAMLDDLDDDRQTTIFDQAALDAQASSLRACVENLSAVKLTVTLDANGGACGVGTVSLTCGKPCGELPTATMSRYAMTGWFTQPEGGTRITEDTIFTDQIDQTWYAQWALDGFWMAGDADGDGSVSVSDVTVIMRYLAGGWEETPDFDHADVNWDGKVNLRDVTLLRRFLADGWGVVLR